MPNLNMLSDSTNPFENSYISNTSKMGSKQPKYIIEHVKSSYEPKSLHKTYKKIKAKYYKGRHHDIIKKELEEHGCVQGTNKFRHGFMNTIMGILNKSQYIYITHKPNNTMSYRRVR